MLNAIRWSLLAPLRRTRLEMMESPSRATDESPAAGGRDRSETEVTAKVSGNGDQVAGTDGSLAVAEPLQECLQCPQRAPTAAAPSGIPAQYQVVAAESAVAQRTGRDLYEESVSRSVPRE